MTNKVNVTNNLMFKRSSFCSTGSCVEVATAGGEFFIRDSKHPEGPVLRFTSAEWTVFLAGAAAGELDN